MRSHPSKPLLSLAFLFAAALPAWAGPAQSSRGPATPDHASTERQPSARDSAQRGVHWLARATAQWADQNNCYGCHVQAVTLEALSVARNNQYEVNKGHMATVLNSFMKHPGGAHTTEGLSHPSFPRTAKTFGGVALARYDALVSSDYTTDLLRVSRDLLEQQQADGSVTGDHVSPPVTVGVMQSTYQAMQTWRQAYARTADSMWLTPIQRAERHLQDTAAGWDQLKGAVALQDINYALMGLMAAGVSPSEPTAARLIRHLQSQQGKDGGWSLGGGASDAYATGQTVYALRTAGRSEQDAAVARGVQWLVSHQDRDGSWGGGGSGKAEAMWAVLGMTTVDVVSIQLSGLQDGARLRGDAMVEVKARDNMRGGVRKVELFVDDVRVDVSDGDALAHQLKATTLAAGMHVVDAVATNSKGQATRRRVTVYAGDVFISQLGSRFEGGRTRLTFRNLAGTDEAGNIRLRIHALGGRNNEEKAALLWEQVEPSRSGPVTMDWSGAAQNGKAQGAGRYLAEVAWVGADGRARHADTTVFFHADEARQNADTAQVAGQLKLKGAAPAAATRVELVDGAGNVVQSTTTTEAGEYRFKNVQGGNYKVRVSKKGFAAQEAEVKADKAAESRASMDLH